MPKSRSENGLFFPCSSRQFQINAQSVRLNIAVYQRFMFEKVKDLLCPYYSEIFLGAYQIFIFYSVFDFQSF